MILIVGLIMGITTSIVMAAYYDTTNHWAKSDIDWATEQGYLKGDGDGNFRPEDTVTRAEYVTGVNRLINASSKANIGFPDVKTGDWYYDEIAKGVYNGIIDDSRNNFRPNEAITRDDAARIVARAYKLANYADAATIFKDYGNIAYKGEVGALVVKKVLNGWPDGNYYPSKTLTRGEYAKILRAAVLNLGLPGKPTTPVASKPSTGTSWDWYYGRDYYRYYDCELELSNLAFAIKEGKIELTKITTYTEASLEVLKKAVADGEEVYNKYKNYKNDYRNYCPYQETINAATKKIDDAIDNLKLIEKIVVVRVKGVTVAPTTASVVEGNTVQLTATVSPANATNKRVTWKSSDETIATVDAKGLVKAVKEGTTTITVTTKDGAKTATSTITVTVAVESVTIDPKTADVRVGETKKLKANILPTNATNKNVTWESDDEDVATVDESGEVTGVAVGTATITVTTKDGKKTATSEITVKPAFVPVTGISVSPATGTVEVNKTITLEATVTPDDATEKTVTWESSDDSKATVVNGVVTGVGTGDVTITAKAGDKTATATITVTPAKYNVKYRFNLAISPYNSATENEIATLKPDDTIETAGTTITPTTPEIGKRIEDELVGYYTFKGYTPDKVENISEDVTFVGEWEFRFYGWTVCVYEMVGEDRIKIENATIVFKDEDDNVLGTHEGVHCASLTNYLPGKYKLYVSADGFNDYVYDDGPHAWSGPILTRKP